MRQGGPIGGRSRVWGNTWGNTRNLPEDGAATAPSSPLDAARLLGKAAVAGGELVRDLLLARARPGKGDGVTA
jgi:hypothetical protein